MDKGIKRLLIFNMVLVVLFMSIVFIFGEMVYILEIFL